VIDVGCNIDTFGAAGGQFGVTFFHTRAKRALFVVGFAIGAGIAAASVGIGDTIVFNEVIADFAGRKLTLAVDAVACIPASNGLGTVCLCCAAMFGIVCFADAVFDVHIFDAAKSLTRSLVANARFPTDLGYCAIVFVAATSANIVEFAAT